MKRFVIILTLTFAASALCNAQNYLQHLQEKKDGQGCNGDAKQRD